MHEKVELRGNIVSRFVIIVLEEFAIGLTNSGEVTLSLGGLLVSALGFAIAAYVRRGSQNNMRMVS